MFFFFVPFVTVARCCIDCNPTSVNIAFIPPVIKFRHVILRSPIIKSSLSETDMVSVHNPCRNALSSCECANSCCISHAGCCNFPALAVGTFFSYFSCCRGSCKDPHIALFPKKKQYCHSRNSPLHIHKSSKAFHNPSLHPLQPHWKPS